METVSLATQALAWIGWASISLALAALVILPLIVLIWGIIDLDLPSIVFGLILTVALTSVSFLVYHSLFLSRISKGSTELCIFVGVVMCVPIGVTVIMGAVSVVERIRRKRFEAQLI